MLPESYFHRQFWFSIIGHIFYGFIFEKSKLYFPYKFSRNILFFDMEIFKFYLTSSIMIFLAGLILNSYHSNIYQSILISIQNRYRLRNIIDIQMGGYLLGLSMIFTGFCPSYLPIYLGIHPVLFLYSIASIYAAYIFFYLFRRLAFQITSNSEIVNSPNVSSIDLLNEKDKSINISYIIGMLLAVIILTVLEMSQPSQFQDYEISETLNLIRKGIYLPASISGILCGTIQFFLILFSYEYRLLTNEWLLNIFHYTADLRSESTNISGRLCIEQLLKILAITFGVRLSLWASYTSELPTLDWLAYILIIIGSFLGGFGMCLSTATFTDHLNFTCLFLGNIPVEAIPMALTAAWIVLIFLQFFSITSIK